MGYVWCDGYVWDMCGVRYVWDMCGVRYVWDMCGVRYVWDMCGVRYANNLLKNPATKRLSGKKKKNSADRVLEFDKQKSTRLACVCVDWQRFLQFLVGFL